MQLLYEEELKAAAGGRCRRRAVLGRAALTLVLVALWQPAGAASPLPVPVAEALRHAGIGAGATAFFAQGVDATEPLVEFNGERPMNPASTMKLVTTYTALDRLGPAFTWKTRVWLSAAPVDGVLHGDVYLKGAGDPRFLTENFWLLLSELRARGVRDIQGDVRIDRSLYVPVDVDPGQFDGEPYRAYNVPPDPFLVNFKSVDLTFVPHPERRQVDVLAAPVLAGQEIGAVRFLDGPCGDWRGRLNPDFSDGAHLTFVGGYPGSCGEKHWPVSVFSHAGYAAALFTTLWAELGGTLAGQVRDGDIPEAALPLFEYSSPSLAEVVRDINKYSNNVMARELYLDLAAQNPKAPASAAAARQVVAEFLKDRGLAMPELVLENGAGLSRLERISADSMGRLLVDAFRSRVMPEFIASLPVVGADGTMRRRLTGEPVAGQAHLKTGSLADVRALAGYVLAESGRRYAVVAFVNHPDAGNAQGALDAYVQWIFEHG